VERKRRWPETSLEETGEKFAQLRSAGIPADETVAGREVVEALERLIPALPRRLRDVVTLSTIEEMLPAEVAAVLEISEAAMRSRLFRARQILREKLTKLLENKHGF
jgi:RNA polymerase sigma factor CnrH